MIFDLWVKNGKSFQEGIAQLFESLAFVTTRNPIKILFSTFVFIILCSLGFFNFRQVSRGEDLWTPRTSDSVRDLKHVEDNYGQFSSGGQALFVADNIVDLNFFEQVFCLIIHLCFCFLTLALIGRCGMSKIKLLLLLWMVR